nr:hypothetical protein [Planctomycetota bacterium]
ADWLRATLKRWGLLPALQGHLAKMRLGYDILRGRPSYDTLVGGHWRARGQVGATQDPLDSGSGMLWISPILPMTSAAVAEVERRARSVLHRHGFEYQVTYSLVSDRALCGVISICYDKSNAAETARARACHDALVDELVGAGYLPYRAAAPTIGRCRAAAPEFWAFTQRLKHALDPEGVIDPGRYIPAKSVAARPSPPSR